MSSSHTLSRHRIFSDHARQTLSDFGEDLPMREKWQTIRVASVSESSSKSDASVKIPEKLESPEAMQLLGFTEKAAAETYDRYLQGSARFAGEEIVGYAKSHIRSGTDAGAESDDWDAALASMGIKSELRLQIMDPKFEHIRLSANAMYWALETIKAKYHFLAAIESAVLGSRPVSLEARMRNLEQSSGGGGGP